MTVCSSVACNSQGHWEVPYLPRGGASWTPDGQGAHLPACPPARPPAGRTLFACIAGTISSRNHEAKVVREPQKPVRMPAAAAGAAAAW